MKTLDWNKIAHKFIEEICVKNGKVILLKTDKPCEIIDWFKKTIIDLSSLKEETSDKEGMIKLEITKKNPKKNAKSYHIETVQDIFNVINSKNINKFIREFKIVLHSGLLLKACNENFTKEGKYPKQDILFRYFEWIDD